MASICVAISRLLCLVFRSPRFHTLPSRAHFIVRGRPGKVAACVGGVSRLGKKVSRLER
jgi:hypothetical protein